jgi:hypothetical protein
MLAKMVSSFIFLILGFLMMHPYLPLRFKTKSIYDEFKEHLLEGDYHQNNHKKKGFSQLLFRNWSVLHYEITQKAVLLLALTGDPIRTFICAVVAYSCLSATASAKGRKVAKKEVQKKVGIAAGVGIAVWVFESFT